MVKVKFCGMTDLDDCRKAVDLSVDFIGFVFYEKSPRYITPPTCRQIVETLDGKIGTVGVFVEQDDSEIREIVNRCRLDYAQVYRKTTIENHIRVVRIANELPEELPDIHNLVLFDSYSDGYGGSGKSFDSRILQGCGLLDRAFVAGGVNADNVQDILKLRPYGIDLVSSIEARKGKKDHRKMEQFMKRVRSFSL